MTGVEPAGAELGIADGRALGCGTRLLVTRPERLAAARAAMDRVLLEIDEACSRFRADSEISRLNASAGKVVGVSKLLAEALETALRAARVTNGAVDPTVGAALRMIGYDRDFAGLPAAGGPIRLFARAVPGWRSLHVDSASRTAWLPAGVEVDLGATAKALASDLAAEAAARASGAGALVSLGGDIAVSGPPPDGGWRIQVGEDSGAPLSDDEETIAIQQGGIATSSTTVRRWRRGAVELHHLIDPATGLPADGPWRTVTVAAGSCVEANTASTAAIVLGDAGDAWLEAMGLPARLVGRHGEVVRLGGWPEPQPLR